MYITLRVVCSVSSSGEARVEEVYAYTSLCELVSPPETYSVCRSGSVEEGDMKGRAVVSLVSLEVHRHSVCGLGGVKEVYM